MYPYLNLGFFHPGTFGLLLWLAAVVGTIVLHKNFNRKSVDADALNVVAMVVVAGVIGAKTWHELQNINDLRYALLEIPDGIIRGWWRICFWDGFAMASPGLAECWRRLSS